MCFYVNQVNQTKKPSLKMAFLEQLKYLIILTGGFTFHLIKEIIIGFGFFHTI